MFTALVVDDDEITRRTLQRSLPFETQTASNIEEALFLATRLSPSVIMLDVHLYEDEMTGIDAVPLFRQASPASQIIVMSAYERTSDRDEALQAGARYASKEPALLRAVALAALCHHVHVVRGPWTLQ